MTYIQDGQASTNAIFGTIGNSAPGLDAIAEMQVLSNSYSAEYGGLAGVVVTTKRGGNAVPGTGSTTSTQRLERPDVQPDAGWRPRNDPNSDTHEHRWGAASAVRSTGKKLFFYGNYEGSNNKAIYGGGDNVPTEAMRAAISAARRSSERSRAPANPSRTRSFPANRIDPSATKIMNFFYRCRIRATSPTGTGSSSSRARDPQAAAGGHPARQRGDARTTRSSCAEATSTATPTASRSRRGNTLTNMPILNPKLNTGSAIGGWTKILSARMVNEFRVGLQLRQLEAAEQLPRRRRRRSSASKTPPTWARDPTGVPELPVQRWRRSGVRPEDRRPGAQRGPKPRNQNAFSISDNLTWIAGGHSLKAGGLWTHNTARDGFGIGGQLPRGRYEFAGASNAQQAVHAISSSVCPGAANTISRATVDRSMVTPTISQTFVQDDWKINRSLTLFLGLRYEIIGNWQEKNDLLANFILADGGHHVVPNAEVAALLPPGVIGAQPHVARRATPVFPIRSSTPIGTISALAAASPGVWTRTTRRCCVVGSACSIRPSRFRVSATCWQPMSSDTATRGRGVTLATGVLVRRVPSIDCRTTTADEGIDPDIQSPDIYQSQRD